MKNENEILRELLHCYQSIVSIDQRTEKMKTLEWVLGEKIQERLLSEYLGCFRPDDTPAILTTESDNTDKDTEEAADIADTNDDADDGDEEQPLEIPECLNKWERPFYGLMHEHPELKPKEIAEIMDCSLMTAHKHYKNIRAKLNIGG